MATGDLLNPEEEKALVARISAIERKTTGEICVHIAKKSRHQDALAGAKHWFEKLRIGRTRFRNGVLVFVDERNRRIAILGDSGIHAHVGTEGWSKLVGKAALHFKKRDYLVGLLSMIDGVGEILISQFPTSPAADGINEIPDELSKSDR